MIQNEANNLGLEQMTAVSEEGKQTQEWVDLPNGCVCCTVKDDLLVTLENLLKKQPFQHIVIELSGLADPGPLIQVFWSDDELEADVYLDAVICVCDSQHILDHLKNTKEAAQQMAFSDRILLNKIDLVDEAYLKTVEEAVSKINSNIQKTKNSEANLSNLLNVKAFDFNRLAEKLKDDPEISVPQADHDHSSDITTVRVKVPGEMDKILLKNFLADLLWESDGSYDVLRLKALLSFKSKKVKYALQAVRDVWNIEKTTMEQAQQEEERVSDFVFIGRNMLIEEWEKGLKGCLSKE